MSPADILKLYRNAKSRYDTSQDPTSKNVMDLILGNDLLRDPGGGLPHDHPLMVEIEAICAEPDAVNEAVAAAERGLPPLAGMEYRIVEALGANYGMHYTVHHAGYCIATQMLERGWEKGPQRPMPPGHVAKSATTFHRKAR
jgi:hypothetical protein